MAFPSASTCTQLMCFELTSSHAAAQYCARAFGSRFCCVGIASSKTGIPTNDIGTDNMAASNPWLTPVYLPGKEPLPEGWTESDRADLTQMQKYQKIAGQVMESCPAKCALSGVAGFGLGAFFTLFSAALSADDPMRRTNAYLAAQAAGLPEPKMSAAQQTKEFFKDTGRNMYRAGRGFGKVGALYSGIECCVEGYRAKHDITNPLIAGGFAGAILARNSGVKAMIGGGVAFAAFSGAIELFLTRETPDDP